MEDIVGDGVKTLEQTTIKSIKETSEKDKEGRPIL
jgi:hypothetical protein